MPSLLEIHQQNGRFIQVGAHQAFVIEKGNGEPVVCLHGVPSSSFLYRKVIDELAQKGYRGISFDLLGMGLSDRPPEADYSWTGLGKWALQVIAALELPAFHLVIHDIGGPVGGEIMAQIPEKIRSLTILNTPLVNLDQFRKPFPMFFFEWPVIGEIFLGTTLPFIFQQLMHLQGIHRKEAFGIEEAKAWVSLLKGPDKGKAFLKIMRSFEANSEKEALYLHAIRELKVPKQIVWGMQDKALSPEQYGKPLQEALGLDNMIEVAGSHFLQEDYGVEVAGYIMGQLEGEK